MISSAEFSSCRNYRYYLTRQWNNELPFVNFIGLNPSYANEDENDPTINKCIKYAKTWGYGGIIMTNLFAKCSTYPKALMNFDGDIIGNGNNEYLIKGKESSNKSIAAWGNNGGFKDREAAVKSLLGNLYCLKRNKTGRPAHPLYLSKELTPVFL